MVFLALSFLCVILYNLGTYLSKYVGLVLRNDISIWTSGQSKKLASKRGRDELVSETETSTGYDSSSQDGEASTMEGSSIAESQLNIMSLNSENNMYSR